MEMSYDPTHNVAYIRLQPRGAEVESLRVSEDLVVDLAPDGTVYGIELLNASAQLAAGGLAHLRVVNEVNGHASEMPLEITPAAARA